MRFLCLVYFEPDAMAALSPSERATIGRDSMAYDQELSRSGHYFVAEALNPVSTAKTVRCGAGKHRRPTAHSPRPRSIWAVSSSSMQPTWTRRWKSPPGIRSPLGSIECGR